MPNVIVAVSAPPMPGIPGRDSACARFRTPPAPNRLPINNDFWALLPRLPQPKAKRGAATTTQKSVNNRCSSVWSAGLLPSLPALTGHSAINRVTRMPASAAMAEGPGAMPKLIARIRFASCLRSVASESESSARINGLPRQRCGLCCYSGAKSNGRRSILPAPGAGLTRPDFYHTPMPRASRYASD